MAICTTLGVSALLVGWLLAGVWKRQGVDSAAEFLDLRFGRSLVQFYLWLQGTLGIFTMGGSVYVLSVIICALVPLPEGHLLVDPATGQLSVTIASLIVCVIVVVVCFLGGLWAVLMTDVLQSIILTAAVLLVVPMLFALVAQANGRVTEIVIGAGVPLFLLVLIEVLVSKESAGWARVEERRGRQREAVAVMPSRLPAQLCGWSVLGLGALLMALSLAAGGDRALVAGFGGGLALIGGAIAWLARGDGVKAAA